MKNPRILLLALAAALLLIFILHPSSFLLAQGSLTPPGAPAPTMKTLDQIEPRVAINATNTPGDADSLFKITQPGSYYLTGNITGVAGKHGIEIAAPANGPGVTIDLMGFELTGVPGSLDGIAATTAGARNIAIVNGAVRAWGGDGVVGDRWGRCRPWASAVSVAWWSGSMGASSSRGQAVLPNSPQGFHRNGQVEEVLPKVVHNGEPFGA